MPAGRGLRPFTGLAVASLALALTGTVLSPTGAAAQRVRGTVRDSLSRQPLAGAVVWLTDGGGKFLARALADENGQFAVIRVIGATQLHVVHIGFRPVVVAVGRAASDTLFDVAMGSIPLTLDTVASSRRRICPGEKGTNAALGLWEQARAALLASVVARDVGAPALEMKSYKRYVDPRTHEPSDQTITLRLLRGDRSYVSARPPGEFVTEGYMLEAHGDRTFFAPDDAVLLDQTFAETHCLRVVDGSGTHAGEVGIGFEPVADRMRDTLVDVKGVLWLSPSAHALRSLEFNYTDLEREADISGGEVIFTVMPTGAPMITRWEIRSARLSVIDPITLPGIKRKLFDRRDRTNVRLINVREDGGRVVTATWPDGRQWRDTTLRTVSGQLVADAGTPIGGMTVWLDDSPDSTVTDEAGNFTLTGVLPGTYMVMASDDALARVSVSRGRRLIDVRQGNHRTANIVYLSAAQLVANACEGQRKPDGTGVLLGRVVNQAAAPIADVQLDAIWRPGADLATRPDLETRSDSSGRFAICGAPLGDVVRLHAVAPGSTTDVEWKQAGLQAMTVVIRPPEQ
ncbi:MAG: carboxypeptidase-like regulatory domain-containing protein [Gemmatimonadales bacterium]